MKGHCRIISLGKLAKHLFPTTHALPHAVNAGEVFYVVGVMLGIILWGFAIVWFIVAVIMIAVSGRISFNMGWWGFIFPVGESLALPVPLFIHRESNLVQSDVPG